MRSLKSDRPGFAGRAVGGGRSPPPKWNDAFGFASEGKAIRVSLAMG